MTSQQDPRAPLLRDLRQYSRSHPERRQTTTQFIDFITSTPDCFERSHPEGHLTGSAWLVNPADTCALLTLHHQLQKWLQPGGHADGDPDLLRTALREAEEESGISGIIPLSTAIFDLDIHPIPANPRRGEPAHLHYDVRYLLQAPHERWVLSAESDALAWWPRRQFTAAPPCLTPPSPASQACGKHAPPHPLYGGKRGINETPQDWNTPM